MHLHRQSPGELPSLNGFVTKKCEVHSHRKDTGGITGMSHSVPERNPPTRVLAKWNYSHPPNGCIGLPPPPGGGQGGDAQSGAEPPLLSGLPCRPDAPTPIFVSTPFCCGAWQVARAHSGSPHCRPGGSPSAWQTGAIWRGAPSGRSSSRPTSRGPSPASPSTTLAPGPPCREAPAQAVVPTRMVPIAAWHLALLGITSLILFSQTCFAFLSPR